MFLGGRTGALNPMYGRTGALNPMYGRTGALNPMFGKFGITPTNAMTIYVYSIDGTLINSFSSPPLRCCSFMVKYISNTSLSIY